MSMTVDRSRPSADTGESGMGLREVAGSCSRRLVSPKNALVGWSNLTRLTMVVGTQAMTKPSAEEVLEGVHSLRTMMIDVGTGERRIPNVEAEYTQQRSKLSNLRELGIKDPNQFNSLWDWYGYWKANGLASYQSRREYVNSLYKPVQSALEETPTINDEESVGVEQPFSVRNGYAPDSAIPPMTPLRMYGEPSSRLPRTRHGTTTVSLN